MLLDFGLAKLAEPSGSLDLSVLSAVLMRFPVDLPAGESLIGNQFQKIAIAPDGTRLAFAVDGRILVRELGDLESRPLPGTEGDPNNLAFSPDGEWIAFWDNGVLKKISLAGGAPLRLCDVEATYGMVWDTDDRIRFGSKSSGIREVSASGGIPEVILDPGGPVWRPQRLPDGQSYLFAMGDGPNVGQFRLAVMKPGDEEPRVLFEGSDNVQLLASGHLLFGSASGGLLAAAFDLSRLELAGAPVPVSSKPQWRSDDGCPGPDFATVSRGYAPSAFRRHVS
jgi:hypothetical protein